MENSNLGKDLTVQLKAVYSKKKQIYFVLMFQDYALNKLISLSI